MVTAISLLNIERMKVNIVAEKLMELDGVSEVFSVSGRYDLVVVIRVATNDELATLATEQIGLIEGITGSETMLAFKAFAKDDLESMFSLGM